MVSNLKNFVKALLWGPDGNPSLTSSMAFAAFSLFCIVSLYLVFSGNTWAHYETFAGVTCGGSLLTKLGDKCINNKVI